MRISRSLAFVAIVASTAAAHAAPAATPAQSRPGYVQADGAVAVVGSDGMGRLVTGIEAIVARAHPGPRYALIMAGSSTGLPALTAGATLLAPLSRQAWGGETAGFKQTHGYEPTAIRIGYAGWGPRPNGKTPSAVYVSTANPLPMISARDLGRAFSMGSPQGDINLWSQLGMAGEAGARRIHLYGVRDDGGFATAFRDRHFGKRPYAVRYEPLESYAAVLHAVATDPFGIAIVGWVDAAAAVNGVRILPIATKDGAAAGPDRAAVAAGRYPLSDDLYLYVDKAPGKPLDPLARAWIEAALSDEGQTLVAAQSDGEQGYLPLSASDLSAERAKLAGL